MAGKLLRLMIILIAAGLLAGGSVVFSPVTTAKAATSPVVKMQSEPAAAADNGASTQVAVAEAGNLAHRPPGDMPIWFRFSGIVGHIIVIALIIVGVTWVQKLMAWLSAKPKAWI